MSLLFIDSFSGGDMLYKWNPNGVLYTTTNTTPRVAGGYYGHMTSISSNQAMKSFSASAQIFVGIGLRFFGGSIATATPYFSFWGDNGTTQHITVMRNISGTGRIEIRRGGTGGTLLATGTAVMAISTWYYIEITATISATVGYVEVRLNGATTPDVTFTGNTKNGGTNTTIDAFSINNSPPATAIDTDIADLYILNSSGTANNTFLGNVAVRVLTPKADGTFSQFVNSASNSTNNYSYVNERPFSSADFTSSDTVGQRDTYTMQDMPSNISIVYGVQAVGTIGKTDAKLMRGKYVLRSGGTNYYGSSHALTTSYISYYDMFETDPATGLPWTVSGINAAEGGMEVA